MRCSSVKTIVISVVILALNYAQIVPSFAGEKSKSNKIKVAFAGIQFDDMPADVRDRILQRVQEMLENESAFELAKPEEVEKKLGAEKLSQFFSQPDSAAFRTLAAELQTDYLFAGRIANQSRETNRVLLVGELVRYDRATNILNKFEVLKYYDNFGVELLKFQEEFVKTIVPLSQGSSKTLPFIVLGGITLAGIVALVLSASRQGAEGEGGGGSTDRP